jgi:hypothetical protein
MQPVFDSETVGAATAAAARRTISRVSRKTRQQLAGPRQPTLLSRSIEDLQDNILKRQRDSRVLAPRRSFKGFHDFRIRNFARRKFCNCILPHGRKRLAGVKCGANDFASGTGPLDNLGRSHGPAIPGGREVLESQQLKQVVGRDPLTLRWNLSCQLLGQFLQNIQGANAERAWRHRRVRCCARAGFAEFICVAEARADGCRRFALVGKSLDPGWLNLTYVCGRCSAISLSAL